MTFVLNFSHDTYLFTLEFFRHDFPTFICAVTSQYVIDAAENFNDAESYFLVNDTVSDYYTSIFWPYQSDKIIASEIITVSISLICRLFVIVTKIFMFKLSGKLDMFE